LLYQRGILLGGLVHLHHRLSHLRHTLRLLAAGGTDFTHDVIDPTDTAHDFGHGHTGLVYQRTPLLDPRHAGIDQALDFLGCIGRSARQAAHFTGHHGKPAALLSGTGCFDSGVECQDVGLKRNAVNDGDDVGNFVRRHINLAHGGHHLGHFCATAGGHVTGLSRQRLRRTGVRRGLVQGIAELCDGRQRGLQFIRSLLRACTQVQAALGDLTA